MTENESRSTQEIDLLALGKVIWSRKRFIIKLSIITSIIGIFIAITNKVEFEASCKLLPESHEGGQNNFGSLGGLAGLAGINLDFGGGGLLTPELYPEIVYSLPFQLEVINDTLKFERFGYQTTSFNYFSEIDKPSPLGYLTKYTIGLPRQLRKLFFKSNQVTSQESDFIRLSLEEWQLVESFRDRMVINVDTESGVIMVRVEMPDPIAAAQLTANIVDLLTNEITEYKIEKVRNNLEFIESSYNDAKKEFEAIQVELAEATDRNKNMSSAKAEIELKRLQHEFDVAFEVYKGLATQVEQAKIKLKEEMPVFTILEPVKIPVAKSKPRRTLMVVIFGAMGFLLSVSIIFVQFMIKDSGILNSQNDDDKGKTR